MTFIHCQLQPYGIFSDKLVLMGDRNKRYFWIYLASTLTKLFRDWGIIMDDLMTEKKLIQKYILLFEKEPHNENIACNLIELYRRVGEYSKAIDFAEMCIAQGHDDCWFRFRLAKLYYDSGDYQEAEKICDDMTREHLGTRGVKELKAKIFAKLLTPSAPVTHHTIEEAPVYSAVQ